MNVKGNPDPLATPPPQGRLILGAVVFGVGFIFPVFIPLVTRSSLSTAWKATLSAVFALGVPELFMLIAVGILGQSGFLYMKARIKRTTMELLAEQGPPQKVGKTRYRIGLVMFSTPLLISWISPYAMGHLPGYTTRPFIYGVVGDTLLITRLFVLGGEFWDKLRSLFIHGAQVRFPKP